MSELRERFEKTRTFKLYSGVITYNEFGGYMCNGRVCFWLNGAWEMFQELNK